MSLSICSKCGQTKPVTEMVQTGHGKGKICLGCKPPTKKEKRAMAKNVPGQPMTCETCGVELIRTGTKQKFCAACAEVAKAATQAQARANRKSGSYVYDSDAAGPTKPDALRLLAGRGVKHPHVQEVVWKALEAVCAAGKKPANRFVFQNGFVKAKASYKAREGQELEAIPVEPVTGELLTRPELYALWDSCVAPYEQTTFEEFLAIRQECKRNCYYLGKEILEKDFEGIHEEWAKWLPQFDPTALPPDYKQKQAIEWLKAQCPDGIREYLMIASRASFKSSFNHIWILTAILCLPDVRVLLVSETRPLSKDFIGVIRSYFEVEEGFETRFQRLFAEYCIPKGDGSQMTLECPMARLRLAQGTANCTSMDSTQAGKRADLIVLDDPISNLTVGNDVQIQASVSKRDALVKLGETGARIILTCGTPWHENDLYAQLIARSANADEPFMHHRIDPAFTVKRQAEHKLTVAGLASLVPDDIESYLFSRFNWSTLRPEMAASAFFLSQNLCIFPKSTEEGLRVTFNQEDLDSHTKARHFFQTNMPAAKTVMALDRAYSTSRYADYSVITTAKLMPVRAAEGAPAKNSVVVWDVMLERWKESELVKYIVDKIAEHKPQMFVAEKDKGWESLELAIRKLAMLRSVAMPYMRWVPTSSGAKTSQVKARRIKKLEAPIIFDQLWFVSAYWNEAVFAQFTKMDGGIFVESNSTRKLDAPDCISLLYENFGPKNLEEPKDETPEEVNRRKTQEERDLAAARRQEMQNRMFGGVNAPRPTQQPPPEPQPAPAQPRAQFPRAGNFATLPASFRGGPKR